MLTGWFVLFLLVVRTFEASALTTEWKTFSVVTGANVSTVSNTVRGVSIIGCVHDCMLGTCNIVGYHKPTKTCFISTDISSDVISVPDPSYQVINLLASGFISQWVESVFAFSSQESPTENAASRIIGEPDVYPAHQSDVNAWGPANPDSSEFIEVGFSTTVNVTSLEIYETLAGGVVTAIKCFQDGVYHSLYVGTPLTTPLDVSRIFSPVLLVPCVSNRIRIQVFTVKDSGDWLEIDAIRLNGNIV